MKHFHFTALVLMSLSQAFGENWPVWRGPRTDSTSPDTKAPIEWDVARNAVWKTEVPGISHASPVLLRGLVFFINDAGKVNVIRPGTTFERVAQYSLGESCYASPAISDGQVFIRGFKHLFCLCQPPK